VLRELGASGSASSVRRPSRVADHGSRVAAFLIYSSAIRIRPNSLKTQGRHHV